MICVLAELVKEIMLFLPFKGGPAEWKNGKIALEPPYNFFPPDLRQERLWALDHAHQF
jgi:hypothetical protein